MARKKSSRKASSVHEMIDTKTENLFPIPATRPQPTPIARIALVVLIVGLLTLFITNKGLIVAAVVDGKPIFRWQLSSVLMSRFGQQTLEGMISQALIDEQAQKAGITVTQADVDAKTKALIASLGGGMTIDQVLAYQGMTRADFDSQLKLQLTVEKLLGKDITVTDVDITNYIATNSATLTATDEAGLKEEARQAILSQKINEKLQPWFAALKAKASILRFL